MPCLPQLSGSQVLLVTAVLNGVFCVSQGVASQLSHSLALLGDSIDMAADTATYALAFWIERRKEQGDGELPPRFAVGELLVASLSGLSLVAGAVAIIRESARRHAGGERREHDVDQAVIFGFAGVNLVVNSFQLSLFLARRGDGAEDGAADGAAAARPTASCCSPLSPLDDAAASEGGGGPPPARGEYEMVATRAEPEVDAADDGADASTEQPLCERARAEGESGGAVAARDAGVGGGCCANINVGAALAHVVADTTRTFSELTAASVIQVFRTDSVRTDADAAIVINVTILLSGLYICYEVAARARVLWQRSARSSIARG